MTCSDALYVQALGFINAITRRCIEPTGFATWAEASASLDPDADAQVDDSWNVLIRELTKQGIGSQRRGSDGIEHVVGGCEVGAVQEVHCVDSERHATPSGPRGPFLSRGVD